MVGVLVTGVQLDRHPAVVADLLERRQRRGEVDRALAGDQVVVDARRGDVFEVDVADELRRAGGSSSAGSSFTQYEWPMSKFRPRHGDEMLRRELQELVGRLDEQVRLRLDQQQHPPSPRARRPA